MWPAASSTSQIRGVISTPVSVVRFLLHLLVSSSTPIYDLSGSHDARHLATWGWSLICTATRTPFCCRRSASLPCSDRQSLVGFTLFISVMISREDGIREACNIVSADSISRCQFIAFPPREYSRSIRLIFFNDSAASVKWGKEGELRQIQVPAKSVIKDMLLLRRVNDDML